MNVHGELEKHLLQTSTQVYCARAGEMIPVDPSSGKSGDKKEFDHKDAVLVAARLIHFVATFAEQAFEAVAKEESTASVWTATKK